MRHEPQFINPVREIRSYRKVLGNSLVVKSVCYRDAGLRYQCPELAPHEKDCADVDIEEFVLP
jgi:hypothetical protein